MPFMSRSYLRSIGGNPDLVLGYHPEAQDDFFVTAVDRYAGTYIIGTQGYGKSGLLQNLVAHDVRAGHAVVVIDPHGDLVDDCVAALPQSETDRAFVLDMLDEDYPFGVNVFGGEKPKTSADAARRINRVGGIFEVLWADVLNQAYLPRYLRAALIVLLANPGSTLVDMKDFLLKDDVRARLLSNLQGDEDIREFWETQYTALTTAERMQRVQPLIGRLESLFLGRPLMRNIMGQRQTTIDFRQAIERRSLIFVKLPIKTLGDDARLLGTVLISQLHGAIFSYADVPESQRPGVSLYVDEFQHFATPHFSEMFTEGRKYGVRVTIAHQYRNQIPSFLQDSTQTARTKVCFHLTPDDAPEMARFFSTTRKTVRPEDMSDAPAEYLMKHIPSEEEAFDAYALTEIYLLPLQGFRHGHIVEIRNNRHDLEGGAIDFAFSMVGGANTHQAIRVDDPLPFLDRLLHTVMVRQDSNLPIPPEIPRGLSNSGVGFFGAVRHIWNSPLLQPNGVQYPAHLVGETADGPVWLRAPETPKEQLLHLIFTLRQTMKYLAEHPIGKVTESSTGDVAKMLTQLPPRSAFAISAKDQGVIYTHNTPQKVTGTDLEVRVAAIRDQTRKTFCRPREDVEGEMRAGPHVMVEIPVSPDAVSSIPNEVDDEHEADPQATRPAADRWETVE